MGRQVCSVLLVLIFLAPGVDAGGVAAPPFPLAGRVTDEAGILSPEEEARLDSLSSRLEAATCHQMLFVTLSGLRGMTIEAMGLVLGNGWGVGHRGHNDGLLLIVAPAERQTRIELGLGTEKLFTSADAKEVLEQQMIPAFRHQRFSEGLAAGGEAIASRLMARSGPRRPDCAAPPATD
ncbi:TPM domain-containing protein [Thermaurantiacus sp.]